MSDEEFKLSLSRLKASRCHGIRGGELVPQSPKVKQAREDFLMFLASAEEVLKELRATVAREASERTKALRRRRAA